MADVEQARSPRPQSSPPTNAPERRGRTGWLDPWLGNRLERLFGDLPEMRVEEFTEGDEAVVRVELPGIDPAKDVSITVADRTLRIHAHRREESKSEEKGAYRSEFRYGSFSRSIDLPPGCNEDDVKATYTDGILEVRVPVDQSSTARRIEVQRG